MGIPDEPFWVPDDVVAAYRAHVGGSRGAAREPPGRPRAPTVDLDAEWQAAWARTGLPGWDADAARLRARRVGRHPQGDPEGARRHLDRLPGLIAGAADLTGNTGTGWPARRRSRPTTRPGARSTTASASTPWARRSSAWPVTAASCRSAARSSCSPTTCARRSASPRSRTPSAVSSSPTTRSVSARTARPTSRSSTSPPCGRSPTST